MNPKIRLILSDIDSTLLGLSGDLPASNTIALAAAVEQGVRFGLATVRKRDSSEAIARQLGLRCAMACQAGATIYDEHGTLLRSLAVPMDLARAIATLADEHGLPLLTTIDEQNYYSTGLHPAFRTIADGIDTTDNLAVLTAPPTRMIVHGEHGATLLMRTFGDAPLRFMRHYTPDGALFDAVMTHTDATKESAMLFLCQHLGIAPAEVMALGDSEADIGMIRAAGVGVAVANGRPDVRAAADWIAPHSGEAGVAAAVYRFVLRDTGRVNG